MSGRLIQALHACSQTRRLDESERQALASCGRSREYLPGETILQPDDTAFCIPLLGRVTLQMVITAHGGDRGGEAAVNLSASLAAFG